MIDKTECNDGSTEVIDIVDWRMLKCGWSSSSLTLNEHSSVVFSLKKKGYYSLNFTAVISDTDSLIVGSPTMKVSIYKWTFAGSTDRLIL